MRVIKEFNLGHLKCSLFVNQERHTLKIEDEFGEVSYKLGRLDIDPTKDIDSYIELPEVKDSLISSIQVHEERKRQGLVTDDQACRRVI